LTTATAETQSQDTSKKPSHIAYTTRQRGEKTYWNACGAAWAHKDGKGFRIKLDALPVGGVIELRTNDPKAPNDNSPIDWSSFSDCEDN
jgi:hypothetical protein